MNTETRQTFPSYAELSPEQQVSPVYLAQHHENPPTIRMKLEDAVREARQVRGIYELSMPTIAAPTCCGALFDPARGRVAVGAGWVSARKPSTVSAAGSPSPNRSQPFCMA